MPGINLLPWRTEQRARLQKRFLTTLAATAILSAGAVAGVYYYYQSAIEYQAQRNSYLQAQAVALDKKIVEIKDLESIKAAVIQRIEVIEQLQLKRPQIVHLFDEWLDTLPQGIYLTGIEQLGKAPPKVGEVAGMESDGVARLQGSAQSNGRVSAYMKQLDESEWLDNPQLVIIQTLSLIHI